jgi:hypothetical protein
MSRSRVAVKCFAFGPAVALTLMGMGAAWAQDAQDAQGAPPAAHSGAAAGHSPAAPPAKPKPAPKPKAKTAPQATAAFDIIPCADAQGKIHKCIRIDPTAGEINDAAKGASYRVIYGQ